MKTRALANVIRDRSGAAVRTRSGEFIALRGNGGSVPANAFLDTSGLPFLDTNGLYFLGA